MFLAKQVLKIFLFGIYARSHERNTIARALLLEGQGNRDQLDIGASIAGSMTKKGTTQDEQFRIVVL